VNQYGVFNCERKKNFNVEEKGSERIEQLKLQPKKKKG
jgi:hypothetical protein